MDITPSWTETIENCICILTEPRFTREGRDLAAKQLREIGAFMDSLKAQDTPAIEA